MNSIIILSLNQLTLQVFVDKHPKPPPPLQDSLKEIFTETFKAFVKDLEAVTVAVGGIVSAEMHIT